MQANLFQAFFDIHPLIFVGILLPLFAAIAFWVWLYRSFHILGLKPSIDSLEMAVEKGETIEGCAFKNAALLEESFGPDIPHRLRLPWERIKRDMKTQYKGMFLPEAEAYFDFDSIISIPAGRKHREIIWGGFIVLGILSLTLPAIFSLWILGSIPYNVISGGLLTLALISLGQGLFLFIDYQGYQKAEAVFYEFVSLFNRILPVADSLVGPALLLEATQRNQEVFLSSSERIEKAAMYSFSHGGVLDALRQTTDLMIKDTLVPAVGRIETSLSKAMKTFSRRQDEEMKFMVDTLVGKIADTLELRINILGKSLEEVGKGMVAMNKVLSENIANMSAVFKEQEPILQQATELFANTAENQKTVGNIHQTLNDQVESLSLTISRLGENTDAFMEKTLRLSTETSGLQLNLSNELTGRMESMAGMMNTITERMNEVMVNAGQEIGKGLVEATVDNSVAISNLAEQSAKLREDYETYFSRMEEGTSKTLDDMDYHIQNVVSTITEEMGTMLKDILEQNRNVLSEYKDSTSQLLQSFEEQAMSMGLYAREMNYDITELSSTMKESVDDFNSKIQDGVNLTIHNFDQGLAELTDRIANTVEGISDAVENLPRALGKKE